MARKRGVPNERTASFSALPGNSSRTPRGGLTPAEAREAAAALCALADQAERVNERVAPFLIQAVEAAAEIGMGMRAEVETE
jgi:hypothetical protein